MIYAVVYLVLGLLTNFVDGYAKPQAKSRAPYWDNLITISLWPLMIIVLSGSFGAAVRMGWKS